MKTKTQVKERLLRMQANMANMKTQFHFHNQFIHDPDARRLKREMKELQIKIDVLKWVLK